MRPDPGEECEVEKIREGVMEKRQIACPEAMTRAGGWSVQVCSERPKFISILWQGSPEGMHWSQSQDLKTKQQKIIDPPPLITIPGRGERLERSEGLVLRVLQKAFGALVSAKFPKPCFSRVPAAGPSQGSGRGASRRAPVT